MIARNVLEQLACVPGFGALMLPVQNRQFQKGMYQLPHSRMYVSRGIGTTFTPVRLNARPEVTLFQLT